jgi:hypothetical protein
MGDDAKTLVEEEQHLVVPVVVSGLPGVDRVVATTLVGKPVTLG